MLIAVLAAIALPLAAASSAGANASQPEIESYSESFDVSRTVASEHLEVQRNGARAHIGARLAGDLGDSFGGVWFDNDAGEYVVAAAGGAAYASSAITQELAETALDRDDYRVEPVDFSWTDLTVAQARLDKTLADFFVRKLVRTYPDPDANALIVEVRPSASDATTHEVAQLAEQAGVDVQIKEGEEKSFESELAACNQASRVCEQPMRGGVGIGRLGWGLNCTSGFRAKGKYDNKHYLLTAAHCIYTGEVLNSDVFWDWDTEDLTNRRYIGVTNQWQIPGGDWAKIDVTNTWAEATPWTTIAYWGGNEEYPIVGEGESIKGNQVCHSGITTGTTCGTIKKTGVNFNPGGGAIFDTVEVEREKAGDNLCLEGGDSGGPVFANHLALGIVSFGTHAECHPGTSLGYVLIGAATQDLEVRVSPTPTEPSATTGTALAFPSSGQATVNGTVDPNGVQTNYHFDFGTTINYESSSQLYGAGSGTEPVAVSGTLSSLKSSTTYHFRIDVQNASGTAKGLDRTFTTPDWRPAVTTEAPTGIKAGRATLRAQINPQGTATSYRFEWGPTSSYGNSVPIPNEAIGAGTSPVTVSQEITGLKGLKTYHYRVVATNGHGTTESSDQTFTTPDWRPVVTTKGSTVKVVSEIGQGTLHGTVNPNGFATQYHFQWATQAEFEKGQYGHTTAVSSEGTESGESSVNVSQTISPIHGESTYHYRLVAENAEGQTIGADKVLTTPIWRPILGLRAVGIGRESATLEGWIKPQGFGTEYRFEWGETAEYGNVVPIPDGEIGSGTSLVKVSQLIEGLDLRAAYHFRLVAENAEGKTISGDRTFITSTTNFEAVDPVSGDVEYPADIVGKDGTMTFVWGPAYSYCGADLSGELTEAAESTAASLSGPACVSAASLNGCGLHLDPGAEEAEGRFYGAVSISCPEGEEIEVKSSNVSCEATVPEQTEIPATFTNMSGSPAKVKLQFSGVVDFVAKGGSSPDCPTGAVSGSLDAEWVMKGFNAKGSQLSLRLDPLGAPVAMTEFATNVFGSTATLNGTVETNDKLTVYAFEYGATTAYGDEVGGWIEKGSGTVPVSEPVEGLVPGTVYHYRFAAQSASGVSYGEDQTFKARAYPLVFLGESFPLLVAGEQETTHKLSVGSGFAEISCSDAHLSGSNSAPRGSLSLDAEYSGCKDSLNRNVTIAMNGCHYTLGLLNVGPPYEGELGVGCAEAGKAIEVKVQNSSGKTVCTATFGPQAGAGEVALSNVGSGSGRGVEVELDVSGLDSTTSGGLLNCGLSNGAHSNGSYVGSTTLLGEDQEANEIGMRIMGNLTTGLFAAGAQSESTEAQPRIDGESFPLLVAGEQETTHKLSVGSGFAEISCSDAFLSGPHAAPGGLPLDAEYSGCEDASGRNVTIAMNGCHYTLGLLNVGPPYEGELGVGCAEAGKAIEVKVQNSSGKTVCTATFGPQAGAGEVALSNVGSGSGRGIKVEFDVSGLDSTTSGGLLNCGVSNGAHSDGTYLGSATLRGF